jgi:hypothetical protein
MPKRKSEYEAGQARLSDPRSVAEADLAKLKGYSVGPERLMPDKERGAGSPLGQGSHSDKSKERKHEARKKGK